LLIESLKQTPGVRMSSTVPRYDPFARFLHWLIVALVVAQYVVAWTMPGIHRGTQPLGLIAWHLELGTAIVAVMIVRIVWRFVRAEPDVVEGSPMLQQIARLTHGLLYALLIIQPLAGWANASARGWSVKLFGAIALPPLAPVGSAAGHVLGNIHQLLAWGMLGLIGLHVAATLYHHFLLRDGVLRRMA
jgi:cytochrome b561